MVCQGRRALHIQLETPAWPRAAGGVSGNSEAQVKMQSPPPDDSGSCRLARASASIAPCTRRRSVNGLSGVRQGGARNSEDGFDLSDAAGVIPRAIHQIFTTLDAHGAEYTVKCSFLELYQARPATEPTP